MRSMRDTVVRAAGANLVAGALLLSLSACGGTAGTAATEGETRAQLEVSDVAAEATDATAATDAAAATTEAQDSTREAVVTTVSASTTGVIDTTDLFTERDLTQTADLSGATSLTVTSGQDVTIDQEGVYVISGEASDATIVVDADSTAKVQLVLDGASITNADFPAIYVKGADKVFVTTAEGSANTLQVTGTFVADGETNTDAVIFSRDDLVLNGLGSLTVTSTANGISCKDDLKVTGGTYAITSETDALEANDSILVAAGDITIQTNKDGLHAENDEDDTLGMVYVCGGTLDVTAADDGIHATTYLQVDGGTVRVSAEEGFEATYVQLNGGTIDLSASDDGINATYKSASVGTPTLEVTGGSITVTMAAGDTDALDSNGDLVISGGEVNISAQFAFDFDGQASFTGGTVYVNGEQVSELANSMMGPGGMGGGPMGGMGGHGGPGGGW